MSLHDLVLLLHILGAGVVVGVVFFSLVLAFKKPLDPAKLSVLRIIRDLGTGAVGWMVVTGVILVYQESKDGNNLLSAKVFWIKMGLIIADGLLAHLIISRKIAEVESGSTAAVPVLKTASLVSALIILLVVTLGFLLTLDH